MEKVKIQCWVARDEDGCLWAYLYYPKRVFSYYYGVSLFELSPELFESLGFTDGPVWTTFEFSISSINKL